MDYPLAAAKGHFYVAACYLLLQQKENALTAAQRAYQAAVNVKSVDDVERGRWFGGKPLPEAQRRELEDFLRPLPNLLQQLRNPTPLPPAPAPRPAPPTSRPKIQFDWVTIPAGEFTMGSNDHDSEKPIHKVYLPQYQIARYPVTNEQWVIFLKDSGYNWPQLDWWWQWIHQTKYDQSIQVVGQAKSLVIPPGKEKHPVVYVSWHDSMAFCKWANTLNPSPSGRGAGGEGLIRLPTEAEWEKAARGTDGRKYPWGNNAPTDKLCNFNRNVDYTTPVGSYPSGKSPYGVLDMAGNVWEWCSSAYQAYPYKADDGREDMNITNNNKILRGGAWGIGADYLRCAYRNYDLPNNLNDPRGFRCFAVPIF